MTTDPKRSMSVYLSYAQEDEALKQEFETYLSILQQAQFISGWVECQVQRGTDWSHVVDSRFFAADLVLLLVSPSLLGSGYCSGAEVRKMFERRDTLNIPVIPIILHRVHLAGSPLENIAPLPKNRVPVSAWPERRDAWFNIEHDIRMVIEAYRSGQYRMRSH